MDVADDNLSLVLGALRIFVDVLGGDENTLAIIILGGLGGECGVLRSAVLIPQVAHLNCDLHGGVVAGAVANTKHLYALTRRKRDSCGGASRRRRWGSETAIWV